MLKIFPIFEFLNVSYDMKKKIKFEYINILIF